MENAIRKFKPKLNLKLQLDWNLVMISYEDIYKEKEREIERERILLGKDFGWGKGRKAEGNWETDNGWEGCKVGYGDISIIYVYEFSAIVGFQLAMIWMLKSSIIFPIEYLIFVHWA